MYQQEHIITPGHEEEEDSDGQPSEMSNHVEQSVETHCHRPTSPEDRVARNQLIAISVLCFVFMVAEIVGEFLNFNAAFRSFCEFLFVGIGQLVFNINLVVVACCRQKQMSVAS